MKKTLYQTIIDYFLQQINTGKLKPGDRIPTELELVEQFGVSRITVTRALRELESQGYLLRIKKKGSFIKEPADISNEINHKKILLPVIAVLLPFDKEVGYDILRGVEEVCVKKGFYVTYHNTNFDSMKEKELLIKLMEDNIAGAIVYPCSSEKNIDIFSKMIIEKFPFIIIDRTIVGIDVPHVISNNFQAGYSITSHIIERGHRRIGFISTNIHEAVSITDRYRGYCKALIDSSITPNSEWVIENFGSGSMDNLTDPTEVAATSLKQLMEIEDRPTAIVVINDTMAMYIVKEALELGIKVPDELSVTGFDNLPFTALLEVPLTTIEQDFTAMGRKSAELVLDLCNGNKNLQEQNVTLETKLISRESVAWVTQFE